MIICVDCPAGEKDLLPEHLDERIRYSSNILNEELNLLCDLLLSRITMPLDLLADFTMPFDAFLASSNCLSSRDVGGE